MRASRDGGASFLLSVLLSTERPVIYMPVLPTSCVSMTQKPTSQDLKKSNITQMFFYASTFSNPNVVFCMLFSTRRLQITSVSLYSEKKPSGSDRRNSIRERVG